MYAQATKIEVSGLGKTKLAALREQAKTLGMSAERYARQLIEDGILLERIARTKSFDELFAPAQAEFRESGMTHIQLTRLVADARKRHASNTSRKKT